MNAEKEKSSQKIFDKCRKMCILFLVRTKAFRIYGTPFCSPFSNFLHTFFCKEPHFPGLFVVSEENEKVFDVFNESRKRISQKRLSKLHRKSG